MKKIIALVLALIPMPVLAADTGFTVPFSQNYLSPIYLQSVAPGQCLVTTTLSKVVGSGSACGSVATLTAGTGVTITGTPTNPIINATGGGGGTSFVPLITGYGGASFLPGNSTGVPGPLTAAPITNSNQYSPALGSVIGHIAVSCASYNATDAANGYDAYTPLNASGLGGGTINFFINNATYPYTAPLALGSVVIPTSPQAGPWVTSASTAVGTPYTVLSGDSIIMSVTAVSSAAQKVTNCIPLVGT